ncbi:MAG: alpha/beta fold hydrolase [Opitutaceae bacterium]
MHPSDASLGRRIGAVLVLTMFLVAAGGRSATAPSDFPLREVREADTVIRDFVFESGERLPELRMHYYTLGTPKRDAQGRVTNAVLVMHGTTGDGTQFLQPSFAGELFGPGQPLDASTHFIVLRDSIGHGGSAKPSDGLRARFPRYGYRDVVNADYRMLTEGLGVNHLKLVMGTSSGGMQTWLWGEMYPEFMHSLMPLGCLPVQISGRNRVWRRMISDAIRGDTDWRNGNYARQPPSLRLAGQVAFFMSSNPRLRQQSMPTLAKADEVLDDFVAGFLEHADANDMLYAIESSYDYDPAPMLEKIRARLVAINSADDLIDPPELGILEREIKRVPRGRSVMIPYDSNSRGHGSHTYPQLWKQELLKLLREVEADTRNPGR